MWRMKENMRLQYSLCSIRADLAMRQMEFKPHILHIASVIIATLPLLGLARFIPKLLWGLRGTNEGV